MVMKKESKPMEKDNKKEQNTPMSTEDFIQHLHRISEKKGYKAQEDKSEGVRVIFTRRKKLEE
jgi:hypothetical protein